MNNRAVPDVWLFSFLFSQLIPKLTTNISTEIEKVLDNKPTRHPLQRWLEESRGPSQDLGSPLDKESSIDPNADQPPPSLMDTIRSTCSLQWLCLCVTDKKKISCYIFCLILKKAFARSCVLTRIVSLNRECSNPTKETLMLWKYKDLSAINMEI